MYMVAPAPTFGSTPGLEPSLSYRQHTGKDCAYSNSSATGCRESFHGSRAVILEASRWAPTNNNKENLGTSPTQQKTTNTTTGKRKQVQQQTTREERRRGHTVAAAVVVLIGMYLRLLASCIQRSASSGVPAAAVSSASVSAVVALSDLDRRSG